MPIAKLFNSDGTEQGQIDLEESVFGIITVRRHT